MTDTETNKSGVLQVCMDGIGLLLDKTKVGESTASELLYIYTCISRISVIP